MKNDRDKQMNPDGAIDRVLAGLAGVEAAPALEQRVLKAVQQRAAKQQEPRFAAFSTLIQGQPWAIAACVVVLSFAASMAVRKRHELKHEDAVLIQDTSPSATVAAPIGIAEAQRTHSPRQTMSSTSPRRENAEKPEDLSDLDALAISEMNAPSKPAPPLSLTHQEALLAEAAHQPGPTDLSSLRPEIRARQIELSKAEFHDFFEPPPVKDNE